MSKNRFSTVLTLAVILSFVPVARGQMQSTNYRITTSVMSGGGVPMASDNYNMDSTLGQSSPLMNPTDPPWSPDYDLYPGFWYTLEAVIPVCDDIASFSMTFGSVSVDANYNAACDIDTDGDVDGSDLAVFSSGF